MLPADAPAELDLPAFDARALARRAALPVAALVVAAGVLIFAGGPMHAFSNALHRAIDADPRWVLAAVGFEVISFSGYIALLWMVGERATPRMDLRASAEVTLAGAAVTRLLPTGGAGGVALTLWALRRTGMESKQATRTLLTFLVLLYAVFLLSIAVASALLAVGLGGEGGHVLFASIAGVGATVAMGLAVASMRLSPREDAGRIGRAAATLGEGMRGAQTFVREADVRLLGAPLWWAFDAAVLYGMLNAFGAPPAIAVVVLGYFVGMVANTIPIPGAVSGGMVGVLLAFGVEADLALASVLSYRALAIWLPAPVGLAALGSLRRTVARWGAEEAGELEPAPKPAAAPAGRTSPPSARHELRARPRRRGNGHRVALLGIGLAGAALFALVQAGVVAPPDLEGALTDLSDTLGPWTYALVGGLAFLETGAFVGLIAPGETAVVLGGVVAAEGGVDLPLMLLITWSAAALGDLASFWLGRRLGRRFLIDHGPRIGVTAPRLERVEDFFDRHGGKAILIGRFIGLVRAVAPFLAGSSGMRLRAFLPWSLLGTAAWATTFTLVGYAFHDSFTTAASHLTHAAFALAIVAAAVFAWRSHRRSRAASFAQNR